MVYVMKGFRQEHFVISVVRTTQMFVLKFLLKLVIIILLRQIMKYYEEDI